MNLQLFAQEKTEKATPRRRQKARERGQIFSSRELNSAVILIMGFVLIKFFGGYVLQNLMNWPKEVIVSYMNKEDLYSITGIYDLLYKSIIFVAKVIAPLAIGLFTTSILINYLQTGFIFSIEPITPKLERISPFEGIKRIFSKKSVMELVKSIIKITVVGYVSYITIANVQDYFLLMLDMDIPSCFRLVADIVYNFCIKIGVILFILSIFDYFYQWYEYEMDLMMSKEDLKEEYKEVEGNPQIKSRIRQIQKQMARSRMMSDVKKADVVITNPTHLAVALGYDTTLNSAPVVLAKGGDKLAQRIRQVAISEDIPIVENRSLAQTLYKSVEVGEIIPEHLYYAVAEVLAFVYSLKERRL